MFDWVLYLTLEYAEPRYCSSSGEEARQCSFIVNKDYVKTVDDCRAMANRWATAGWFPGEFGYPESAEFRCAFMSADYIADREERGVIYEYRAQPQVQRTKSQALCLNGYDWEPCS